MIWGWGIGPNSREGQLGEAISNLPLHPQEMVKFTPIEFH